METTRTAKQEFLFQNTFHNSIVAAYLGWQDSRNDRFQSLLLGNGQELPSDAMEGIAQFMETNRILHTWKKGDIMALDNSLVMHSRNPFTSPRRVLASIWGPPKGSGGTKHHAVNRWYQPLPKLPGPADPLVFGFWKVPKESCAETCYQAIKAGYRRLDCACDYGNEVEVGQEIGRAHV